ncbi:hypothetical protein [Kineobactrum salinum]|uniref:Transcriptional regulator SutA RNAP-binding domain-containing protein n=1 Tax=Kineobactrum salinum TaxID=2708301 RepID=A0A6C0U717_9GAMM|nr:hypothetical protein [Kineobactrum salinum]QIB67129.1 hypothetical protein G3T16_18725 [Kineobactrum salinum]
MDTMTPAQFQSFVEDALSQIRTAACATIQLDRCYSRADQIGRLAHDILTTYRPHFDTHHALTETPMSIGHNPPQTVITDRARLDADIAAFLARGGVITAVAQGVGKDSRITPPYNPSMFSHAKK